MTRSGLKKARMTVQRGFILDALRELPHPSAEEIHASLRYKGRRVSLEAIYRNLRSMSEAGEVRRLDGLPGQMRFDADLSDHSHALCAECGRLADVASPHDHPPFNPLAIKAEGFLIRERRLLFIGLCPPCAGSRPQAAPTPPAPLGQPATLDRLLRGERLEALLGSGATGFIVSDEEGRILVANQAYCDIYGYPLQELVGACYADLLVPPEEREAFLQRYRLFLESEGQSLPMPRRFCAIRKDGAPVDVVFSANVLRGPDGERLVTSCVHRLPDA